MSLFVYCRCGHTLSEHPARGACTVCDCPRWTARFEDKQEAG